jgi:hypothetical protein
MPLPANTLQMMAGNAQFGPIEMGSIFTVLKIYADQKANNCSDSSWYG